ncbi:hypothetical protein [Oceanicoccus sp. KOV_DT_Chl]|uniref:hypothetical protein n=1 Tax=Oceanicoccus sp. KOV_DT_Chl TaxID=1904639 RepID=UPI000C7C526C|nr:hypothetical protein [Oceanicoccus sp. KOV_DT_Chl]
MANYVLAAYAVIIIVLFIWSFRWGDNASPRLWLLRLMMFGMCYDNVMQAIGNWAIETQWYLPMSYPRWALHVMVLPFLTMFGVSIMALAGIRLGTNKLLINLVWVIIALSIVYGVWSDVINQQLMVVEPLGVTKYTSAHSAPPYPTLFANAAVVAMSIAIWRVSGWPWLFAGALFIFLVNGSTAGQEWSFLSGNMAEVVFMFALLNTERHFYPRRL